MAFRTLAAIASLQLLPMHAQPDHEVCANDEAVHVPETASAMLQKSSVSSKSKLDVDFDEDKETLETEQPISEFALTEEGFSSMQSECCLLSFDMYTRRILIDLGMEICDEGCHNGFMPFFYCGQSKTLEDYITHIKVKSEALCACYAPIGSCVSGGLPQTCLDQNTGAFNAQAHRRRVCTSISTTLDATTSLDETTTVEVTSPTTSELISTIPATTSMAASTTSAVTTAAATTTTTTTTPPPPQ